MIVYKEKKLLSKKQVCDLFKQDPFFVQEVQLSYQPVSSGPIITGSLQSFQVLKNLYDPNTIQLNEKFYALFLNRRNRVIISKEISNGGTCGTVVDLKIIFAIALKCLAQSIIISHNHPSGGTKPSDEDNRITERIKSAGLIMDVELLDHLIICKDGYYSYADEGRI